MTAATRITVLIAVVSALGIAVAYADAVSVVLDDFEAGVGEWRTNDREAAGERPSEIATIYTVGRQVNDEIEQAALIEFLEAEDTWASVSLSIDGALWARHNVGQLSMWMRGDGSDRTIDLTLRTRVGEERLDVAYVYPLSLESDEWERRAIRLFAFEDAEGNPPTAEAIRNAYLLQFAKTGSWQTMSLYVDDIIAEPIPGAEDEPLFPDPGPLPVRVDFTQTHARMLGQVGANIGDDPVPLLDSPARSAAIGRAVEQLVPTVIRLRLSDFYDPAIEDYNLIRLNRVVNWVNETGARVLICLNPALIPAEDEGDDPQIEPHFQEVALRLVALRRGGPTIRYYELFDRPLETGQFSSVEDLVEGYNSLLSHVLQADPEARVGGPGFSSADESDVHGFLRGADRLHFLSLHFYGAGSTDVECAELLEAAATGTASDLPEQVSLGQIRELAQSMRRPMPELFVVSMAANSARRSDGGPADVRVGENFGAAWTVAAVLQSGAYTDKFLQHRLYDHEWGLLDDRGRSMPLFVAAWLLRNYAPRGSTLCEIQRPDDDLVVGAVWTGTARNALVAYAGEEPRSVAIDAWGIGSPVMVRERRLTADGELGMFDRPNAASQTIEFAGPGVSVIQFVHDE